MGGMFRGSTGESVAVGFAWWKMPTAGLWRELLLRFARSGVSESDDYVIPIGEAVMVDGNQKRA